MSSKNFNVNIKRLSSDPEVKKAAARYVENVNDARNLINDKASEARGNFIKRLMVIGEGKESHIWDTLADLLSSEAGNEGRQNDIGIFLRELSEQALQSPRPEKLVDAQSLSRSDTLPVCRHSQHFNNSLSYPEGDERAPNEDGELDYELALSCPQSPSEGHIVSNATKPEDESKQSTSQQNNMIHEDMIPETPMKAANEPVRASDMDDDSLPSESESQEDDTKGGPASHGVENNRDEDQSVLTGPGSPCSDIATSSELDDQETAAQEETPNSTPERAGTDLETEKHYTEGLEGEKLEDEELDEGYDRPRESITPTAGIPIQSRAEEDEEPDEGYDEPHEGIAPGAGIPIQSCAEEDEEPEASSSNDQLPKSASIFGRGGYGLKRPAEDCAHADHGKKVKFMHQAEEGLDHNYPPPYEDAKEDFIIQENDRDNLIPVDAPNDEPEPNSMAAITGDCTVVHVEWMKGAKQRNKDKLQEGFYDLVCNWCEENKALEEDTNPTQWLQVLPLDFLSHSPFLSICANGL